MGRQTQTRPPQPLRSDRKEPRDTEARQKAYADKRSKAGEKDLRPGDKVGGTQKRTNTKTLWNPKPRAVKEIKGPQLVVGGRVRGVRRAKNYKKKLRPRPEHRRIQAEY